MLQSGIIPLSQNLAWYQVFSIFLHILTVPCGFIFWDITFFAALMALQNIGASNRDDAFYRYKMPKLITKIEGRGNGIKTNLVNMVDVAKALARSPSYTTKYFGYELGAQSKFDKKTGTSIVNGAHETSKLANLLEIFIKKYVQCYGCGNPETEIVITKSQTITLKCAACGHVSIVDMRDKITGFILKNPPQHKIKGLPKDDKSLRRAERERLKEGLAADHEEKKKLKRSDHLQAMKKKCALSNEEPKKFFKKNGQNSEYGHGKIYKNGGEQAKGCDEDEDGVQWQTDTSIAAAKQRMKEQLNSVTSEMVILSGFNDGHDCKHSNKVTQKQFSSGSDCEEGKTETLKKHTNGVSKILSENEVGQDGSQSRQANVIANASLELLEQGMDDEDDGIDSKDGRNTVFKNHANYMASKLIEENKENLQEKLVEAYFVALFGGVSKELSKEIEKEKGFLVKVVQNVESQRLLLRVLESYCSKNQGIGRHIALVLKVLYDGDILEEEQILEWYDQVGYHKNASRVRKDAFPFVQWLREAETEDEE